MKTENLNHVLQTLREQGSEDLRPWPSPVFISTSVGASRDRVDLVIDRRSGSPRLGLFDRERQGITDIETCVQLSPALDAWLADFRKIPIPVDRGSVRLRVSPSGQRGVWLDLANIDVKRLLDERTVLDQLRSQAIVEIGQRRKRLVERDGQLKLADPILEPWFETYVDTTSAAAGASASERPIALYCAIGSFTQPGFQANRALVGEVRRRLRGLNPKRAIEYGSGIGNFTLPLASTCGEVHAYEIDQLALQGMQRSLDEAGLRERAHIKRASEASYEGIDLVFVDPPRSGLQKFLDPLEALPKDSRPANFIYVSCFAESFGSDAKRLLRMGYDLTEIAIVDQFPQSRHYEIVASFAIK